MITVKSSIMEKNINRYTHVPQNTEDLLVRQKLTRELCGLCGGCFQRCMANDTISGISIVTKEMDDDLGTD
jgi:aromatic ring hydroxylase